MTREEAKEILTHNWTRVDNPNYSESELDEAFFMAIEVLQDRPNGEWILCSERLPSEKDGRVLITKCGEVMIATYSEFSGTWYFGEMCAVGGEDPIAWIPLPTSYKGGDSK